MLFRKPSAPSEPTNLPVVGKAHLSAGKPLVEAIKGDGVQLVLTPCAIKLR
jgi:hypothetical protein